MLVENPDAFKSWLTSILAPLCDADPAALSKYIYALVKKDKPVEDLRDGMLDQLDVFLQDDTKPFVDMLFKALETHEYLTAEEKLEEVPVTSEENAKEPVREEPNNEHVTNGILEERPNPIGNASSRSPPTSAAPRHRVVVSRQVPAKLAAPAPLSRAPHNEQTLVKVLPLTELLEEPLDMPRRRDRRVEIRDKDDRRRRRSRSWERNRRVRRHGWREQSPHQNNELRRRPPSRSPSPRGRYRNRSPPLMSVDCPPSRSRSRSPVPMRDNDRERERLRIPREMERDRMSRDREHRERVSRSRDRDRERDRSRDRSRSVGTPSHESHHDDMAATANLKRRCQDYDEKGYCMRGELCQWDHGTDPVVLEEPTLSQVLTMTPSVPEYNPLAPDIWRTGYSAFSTLPPPRELVPIPRIRDVPLPMSAAMPPLPPVTAPMRHPIPNHKRNFDYNKQGSMRPPLPANASNCSLEVKKVPRGMNDITHLNNHFSKFGKIVNIQVCFENDPEAALITFSNHTEANVAYKSTEAVLNNRFIKVFWHNAESKQENVPPMGAAAAGGHKPSERNVGHPTSHNKVLINKDNMKATADNKILEEKAKEEAKELAAKMPVEKKALSCSQLHKRAQTLLETQLQLQNLLIQKMESPNLTEVQKKELMSAIQSSQEGIEKLRKELLAYNKAMQAAQGETVARSLGRLHLSQAKKPKSREEAEKEILDAELDIFTKQQEGQDVTDLLKKVSELRRQMAMQFPTHSAARRLHNRAVRFNPSTRFTRVATNTPKVFVNQSVDHRPRALLISGFESDEIETVVKHFSQFGEIVGKEVNLAVPELTLQYRVRAHAELAITRAKHYNDRTLSITWVTNNKPITPVAPIPQTVPTTEEKKEVADQPNGTVNAVDLSSADEPEVSPTLQEDTLLRFDEEEEEDTEEDRSWRR